MLELLWLIPAIPLVSAFALAVLPVSRRTAALLGVGSTALSAVVSLMVAGSFLSEPPMGNSFTQVLWTWISVGRFRPEIGFYLDPISLVMVVVVTFVSFLIHLYSAEFMIDDDGYSRFFAYMNLFVGSMLTLVLADNLLLLYLGWEGVGLCSYLLIGFWYRDPVNGLAGRKAFIVTRVGDTAMAIGLFLLFHHLGTLQIQTLMQRAAADWPVGSATAVAAAALLLGGAVGKSAQLPLQTWLPDAMAGPTPTSALIHAATMVTAGVYLIARTHVLFSLAPVVQSDVAVIGAATLLLAGCSALVQSDIKRVLAYSTISQIGYMFLALGAGAWAAAMFHFMTHAFFKALLFLGAGIIIQALHEEHSIFRMGGLRTALPSTFWTFLIAACSLAGLPFVTAGYFSKDWIIWGAWAGSNGKEGLWIGAVAGVLLTSLYTFRLVFLVFFGERKTQVYKRPGSAMVIPLVVLAALSVVAGYGKGPFAAFLQTVFPWNERPGAASLSEGVSGLVAGAAFLLGLCLAYVFFFRQPRYAEAIASSGLGGRLHRFWFADWSFDWFYDRVFVQPILWFARVDKRDAVDGVYTGIARLNEVSHRLLSRTQTGSIRWYAAWVAVGSIVFLAVVLFL